MRKFFTLLWLLFPVAVLYYHFNEGQNQMTREKARVHVAAIRELEQAKEPDWELLIEEYGKLTSELPANEKPLVRHQIRLAKAKARLEMLDVVGAITDLNVLLQETAAAPGANGRSSCRCKPAVEITATRRCASGGPLTHGLPSKRGKSFTLSSM